MYRSGRCNRISHSSKLEICFFRITILSGTRCSAMSIVGECDALFDSMQNKMWVCVLPLAIRSTVRYQPALSQSPSISESSKPTAGINTTLEYSSHNLESQLHRSIPVNQTICPSFYTLLSTEYVRSMCHNDY